MTCHTENTQFELAMELLIENGFDGIASAMTILLNAAMKIERSRFLQAEPYAYLRYIFEKLPLAATLEDYEALLPWKVTPEQLACPRLAECG